MDALYEFLKGNYAVQCLNVDELKNMIKYLVDEDLVYYNPDCYKNYRKEDVLLSDGEENIRSVNAKNVKVPIITLKNFIWRVRRMDLLEGK